MNLENCMQIDDHLGVTFTGHLYDLKVDVVVSCGSELFRNRVLQLE